MNLEKWGYREYDAHDKDLPPSMKFSQLFQVELEKDSLSHPKKKRRISSNLRD